MREQRNSHILENIMPEITMKMMKLAWISVILCFTGSVFSQISQDSNFPHKGLIFPQVAAGGQYQTWITVTNRGTKPWDGTFSFYSGNKTAWNPYINDVLLTGGSLEVVIPAKGTNTYKVTLPGNTEAGYLIAKSSDTSLDNFLEGNLTYYVSNDETILDSVGIMPSKPILASSIPFEDFSSLCFALVNSDTHGRTATVTLTLYSDTNAPVGTPASVTLEEGAYKAQYLWQTFPSVPNSSWRGRIEIRSNVPVSGVALTQAAGGQLSSLPLDATTMTYSIVTSSADIPFAKMTFWTEGLFVNGYGTAAGYSDVFGLFGQIDSDGSVELHFRGTSAATSYREVYGFCKMDGEYTPGQSTITGTFSTYIPSVSAFRTGTFTATLTP
jgi:hypothetical protein